MSKQNSVDLEKVFYIGRKVKSMSIHTNDVVDGVVCTHQANRRGFVDGLIVRHDNGDYVEHDSFSITALNGDE